LLNIQYIVNKIPSFDFLRDRQFLIISLKLTNQSPKVNSRFVDRKSKLIVVGCKSRLLFAKIAMAIWCQVSGVRCQEACPNFEIHLFRDVPFRFCHEQMVNGLSCFASIAIHAFDFVTEMPVIIFLGELDGRAV